MPVDVKFDSEVLEAWEGGESSEWASWDGGHGDGDAESEGDSAEIEDVVGVYDAEVAVHCERGAEVEVADGVEDAGAGDVDLKRGLMLVFVGPLNALEVLRRLNERGKKQGNEYP
jgi:hypothetical protein